MKKPFFLALLGFLLLFAWSGCTPGPSAGDLPTITPLPATSPAPTAVVISPPRPEDLPTARVVSVVDGDTVDLDDGQRVRLIGINTPERDQPFYGAASAFTRDLLRGQPVGIEYDLEQRDQYGRTLAYLWLGETLANQVIVAAGYANAYTVPPNVRYSPVFLAAEQDARSAGRGLWAPATGLSLTIVQIEYDPPGDDLSGEFVLIRNDGSNFAELGGFTLQDAANNVYAFPVGASLPPGGELRLYSGGGANSADTFYWNSTTPIWNNNGDVATLRDDQGQFLHIYRYGG